MVPANFHERLFRPMIRIVIENILLFLLPTRHVPRLCAADARARLGRRRHQRCAAGLAVRRRSRCWSRATLIYYATITPGGKPGQTYTPPRMKDGRIEPGQLK